MPKEKKRGPTTGGSNRHAPLGQVIAADENRSKYATVKSRYNLEGSKQKKIDKYEEEGELLDEKSTQRIFELSKEQMLEIEMEEQRELDSKRRREMNKNRNRNGNGNGNGGDSSDDDEEDTGSTMGDILNDEEEDLVQHDAGFVTVADGAQGLSPDEEAVVAAMMGGDKQERRTLADIIMQKIEEKELQQAAMADGGNGDDDDGDDGYTDIPPKVAEVYTDIGKILSRYTAGKLPKAFKVIPSLANWEEVLYLTRPDEWTPQAMFAATRIFASNLNPKMAQRFYNLVLLDAVRADIVETQNSIITITDV